MVRVIESRMKSPSTTLLLYNLNRSQANHSNYQENVGCLAIAVCKYLKRAASFSEVHFKDYCLTL